MLSRALAILAAIGGALAVFFRLRSKQHQSDAAAATQRADTAEASADIHRRVNEARAEVQRQHRQEQQAIGQEVDAGKRDHLDNQW
jgi:predicted ATPase with chaperone activity